MGNAQQTQLERILKSYFKEIHEIYTGDNFREESFYPTFKKLIEECSKILQLQAQANVLVLPKETKAGIPDFRVGKNGEIVGYIEAKTPDANLRDIEYSEQLERYKNSLPNLILTNFLEFRLYRFGELIDTVEVGRQSILKDIKHPPIPEKLDLFWEFLEKFFSFSTPEIQKSSALAIALAKRTRFLEHILKEELSLKNEQVTRFYKAFQEELIETLTENRFSDIYAQTITYGLFASRMKTQGKFTKENAWESIPESLPLLREIFHSMVGPHFPESLTWVVDDITQVLEKADISSILKEFKTTKWEDDPVIHFYETFLATYNPKERQRLGVYYTPLPVVSYIVRSIHHLLKEKFNKAEGLATNDVTLLDPSAGTLTFVVQAIKQVQKELEEKKKEGLLTSYIAEHIIPHFHAFEILVAPYTVGHFKVSMVLEEMGYKFKEGERFQFYLTNTLEMKKPKQMSFLIDLAKEGEEAMRVKEKVPIIVVLGNPPYSVSSENKSEFIEKLMDDYKEDVREERNIQPLSDDYIKFIRFAHWKIEQAGKGVLGFITNNSYLSGVIHRGMRKKLLETFDEIYILNLHGSSRIGEKTPEGGKDENVFDIQQGVAIALYVKLPRLLRSGQATLSKKKKFYYADQWGLRKEDKYPYLLKNDVKTTKWQELKPVSPYYFFVPKDFALQSEYDKFWKVTDIFKKWSSGIVTSFDNALVGFSKSEIERNADLMLSNLPNDILVERFKTNRINKIRSIFLNLKNTSLDSFLVKYTYRPFDFRYILYYPPIMERAREDLAKNLLKDKNIAIILSKVTEAKVYENVYIVDSLPDYKLGEFSRGSYFFPLYIYPDKAKEELFNKGTNSNFTAKFLNAVKESLRTAPSPEKIFYYIYAVLFSPTYRKRYKEFLKIDFPSIPLPSNNEVFKKLGNLGQELIDLHLFKSPALDKTEVGFPKSGANTVEKVSYDEKSKRVFINNEQSFEGVSKEVWEYRIGAYQVMEKYLKDRKGRKLSLDEINHYIQTAKAIELTIELQGKIDKVILL